MNLFLTSLLILMSLCASVGHATAGLLDCSEGNVTMLGLDTGAAVGGPDGHPDNVLSYNCNRGVWGGGEVIYTLDIPEGPWRRIEIIMIGPDPHIGGAGLLLLENCDEESCIAWDVGLGRAEITRCLEGGRRYYIVSDGSLGEGHTMQAHDLGYCWNLNREEGRVKRGESSSWGRVKEIFR